MRQAKLFAQYNDVYSTETTCIEAHETLKEYDLHILAETTQGYGLSLDGGYYPYCTSINLDPYHLLGDLEVPFGLHNVNVWMVIRTLPIRIMGDSGPLEGETTWSKLRDRYGEHIHDEYTTVTNRLRRVGEFDSSQVAAAVRRLRPTNIVLNFFDYLFPEFDGLNLLGNMKHYLNSMEASIGQRVSHIGYGPGKIVAIKALI
jgi:adenylosuccinate synthase